MVRAKGSVAALLLWAAGCSGGEGTPDSGPGDAGLDAAVDAGGEDAGSDAAPRDGGPPPDAALEPGFEHCPPASSYVGDSSWPGLLTTDGAMLCVYPSMFEMPADALARKQRLKLVAGSYPFPTTAEGAPFRIPGCLEQRDSTTPPEILQGTVTAEVRPDWDETVHQFLEAHFPLASGPAELRFYMTTEPGRTEVDLGDAQSDYGLLQAGLCASEFCRDPGDMRLLPCRLTSNMCDQLQFTGGSVTIDQFHWAGQVGSGFAAAVRVRGSLDGVDFDIDAYHQMTVTYGHHAFSRGLTLFFDEPIAGACGLSIEEIAESTTSEVVLIDCTGAPLGMRTLTGQTHMYREPCPP